jgi:hypothetical protein
MISGADLFKSEVSHDAISSILYLRILHLSKVQIFCSTLFSDTCNLHSYRKVRYQISQSCKSSVGMIALCRIVAEQTFYCINIKF